MVAAAATIASSAVAAGGVMVQVRWSAQSSRTRARSMPAVVRAATQARRQRLRPRREALFGTPRPLRGSTTTPLPPPPKIGGGGDSGEAHQAVARTGAARQARRGARATWYLGNQPADLLT